MFIVIFLYKIVYIIIVGCALATCDVATIPDCPGICAAVWNPVCAIRVCKGQVQFRTFDNNCSLIGFNRCSATRNQGKISY